LIFVFCFWCLGFAGCFLLGIAVIAPRASYSFATAQKSNQKRPPLQLRPVKGTGFPSRCMHNRAAPELAKNAQTCWHRKPTITQTPQWLALKVDDDSKEKNCIDVKLTFQLFILVCMLIFCF